jgi:hypothetical protein
MHAFFLGAHNILRWLVLLTGVVALLRYYRGLATGASWTRKEAVSLVAYAQTLSVQMLLGLILYFFLSPLGMRALGDMGAAMSNSDTRFFALEHPITTIASVALAHIAVRRTRKAATDRARFRVAAILVTISLLLVLARMPWARPMFPNF